MPRLRQWGWFIGSGVVVLPALGLVASNADLFHLIVGLSGVRWRPMLLWWLLAGVCVTGVALWRTETRRARIGLIALGISACSAFALLLGRGRAETRVVHFTRGGMTYGATLYLAPSPVPRPLAAVVFVHGSAPFKRAFYDLWAEHIARAGLAVLVTDKRGVGETGGVFERENNSSRANLSLLASDVVTAVDYAATLPEIDSTRLGLVGFSQAGWVAPLAATMSPRVRFLALISGPAVSVHEEGVWSRWRGDDDHVTRYSRAEAERMMDTVAHSGVDARLILGELSIPGLWLFGAEDTSIPSLASVRALDSLVRQARKPFTADTFPGYGHLLVGRAGTLLPRIAPASWDSLTRWLGVQTRRVSSP